MGAEAELPSLPCPASVKEHVSSIARRIGRIQAVPELKGRSIDLSLDKAKAVAFRLSDRDDAEPSVSISVYGAGRRTIWKKE